MMTKTESGASSGVCFYAEFFDAMPTFMTTPTDLHEYCSILSAKAIKKH